MLKVFAVLIALCLPAVTFASGSNFNLKTLKAGDVLVGKLAHYYQPTGSACTVKVVSADGEHIKFVSVLDNVQYAPLETHRTFDLAGIRYQNKGAHGKQYASQAGSCFDQTVVTFQRESFGSNIDLNYESFHWCEHMYGSDKFVQCLNLQKQ